MLKEFFNKLRKAKVERGMRDEEIKYYQSARHYRTLSSYKMKSLWKADTSWKYDYWKK